MLKQPLYIQNAAGTFQVSSSSGQEENGLPRLPQMVRCQLQEPDYKWLIPNAALRRRMSRLVRMGVATGLQCLQGNQEHIDAILTATGLGCLADTEKFMHAILDNEEQLLAPTAFIQSTFNTVGAQIALLTGNHGYNNTYVHRGFSFESALLESALLIGDGEAAHVLAGAVDEMTPVLHTLLGRMGYWRHAQPGEGAVFFLLSGMPGIGCRVALQDMELFSGSFAAEELTARTDAFLKRNEVTEVRMLLPETYKEWCGEYPTAASFALWYAYCRIQELGDNRPWLIRNHFLQNHSLLLLKPVE